MKALFTLAVLLTLVDSFTSYSHTHTQTYARRNMPMPSRKIIYSVEEITNFLSPGCLVCIDVDDTLFQHAHLGSIGWLTQRMQSLQRQHMPCQAARRRMLREAVAISTLNSKKLLEPSAPELFQTLVDNSSIFLMGISSKGIESVPSTLHTLCQKGIDFDIRPLFPEDFFLYPKQELSASGVFTRGVLFCGGFSETEAITELWLRKSPDIRRMVFVHGDPAIVQNMGKLAKSMSLAYTGLVYHPAAQAIYDFIPPLSTAVAMQSEAALKVLPDDLACRALESFE